MSDFDVSEPSHLAVCPEAIWRAEARRKLEAAVDEIPALHAIQHMIIDLKEPTDAELDEIDARATAFLLGLTYDHDDLEPGAGTVRLWAGLGNPVICQRLTRSRDALESVRPPDWRFFQEMTGDFRAYRNDLKIGELGIVQGFTGADDKLPNGPASCGCMRWCRGSAPKPDRSARARR